MNPWKLLCKNVGATYSIMFCIGTISLIFSGIMNFLSVELVVLLFPIPGAITAAYLWIRPDVWRDNEEIKRLAGSNDATKADLLSRRTDSRVALALLIAVTITQFLVQNPKKNCVVLIGILFILIPVSNCIARLVARKIKLS